MTRVSPLPLETRLNRLAGLALLAGLSITVPASQSTGRFAVSATVPPRVTVVTQAPSTLTLTTQDVQRGLVVVKEPIQVDLAGNASNGVELDLHVMPGLFESIRVQDGPLDARLPGDGGTLAYRWPDPAVTAARLQLQFTFGLEATATPGTYPWPVAIRGRHLESTRATAQPSAELSR